MSAAPLPEGGSLSPRWSAASQPLLSQHSPQFRRVGPPVDVGAQDQLGNGTASARAAKSLDHGSGSIHGAAHATSPRGSTSLQHRGTVLVVDDMAINRAVLGQMVRKAGLDVVEATNGAEAMEQVATHPPGHFQCILMDLQMPVVDGWQATQQIRAWEAGYSRANSAIQLESGAQYGSPPAAPYRMQTYMTDDVHVTGSGPYPPPSRSHTCLTDELRAGLYQPPSRSGTYMTDEFNVGYPYPPPSRSHTNISGCMAPTAEEDEQRRSAEDLAGQSSRDLLTAGRMSGLLPSPSRRSPVWHGSAVGLGASSSSTQQQPQPQQLHAFLMPPIASVQHLTDQQASASRAHSISPYHENGVGCNRPIPQDAPSTADFLDGGAAFLVQRTPLDCFQQDQEESSSNYATPDPELEAEAGQHSGGVATAGVSFQDVTDTDLAATLSLLNPALLEPDRIRAPIITAVALGGPAVHVPAVIAATGQPQVVRSYVGRLTRSVRRIEDSEDGVPAPQGCNGSASIDILPSPSHDHSFLPGSSPPGLPPMGSAKDKLQSLQSSHSLQQQRRLATPSHQNGGLAAWQRPREGLAVPSPQVQQLGFPSSSTTATPPPAAAAAAATPLPAPADTLRRMRTTTALPGASRPEGRASADWQSMYGYGRSQSSMLTSPAGSYPPPRIPIVACTAEVLGGPPVNCQSYPQDSAVGSPPVTAQSHALSCGVDECVRKPLSFEELCGIFKRYAVIPSDWEKGPAGGRGGVSAQGQLRRGSTGTPAPHVPPATAVGQSVTGTFGQQ